MTAMLGSSSCSPAHLAATRTRWHRVAEHVLASALHAASGEIPLAPSPGSFRTSSFGTGGRFLAVDGAELVVDGAEDTRRTGLTTVRVAADFAGITPGAPRLLVEWHDFGAQAMSRFAAETLGDEPSPAWLWPEHSGLGITAGAINYGASPGDDQVSDPYMYVGPHEGPPPGEPAFWNAPSGAARTFRQIGTADEAAAFFHDGRARVLAHDAAIPTRRTP